MRVYNEVYGKSDFDFWGEAICNVNRLTDEEFNEYIDLFADSYTMSNIEFNDLFAYYIEEVLDVLGIDEEEFYNREV